MKQYNKALFVFRRDLRTTDNNGLIAACKASQTVVPCFIFDDAQINEKNSYRSMNAVQFMIASLKDLQKQLAERDGKLYLFHGTTTDILDQLIRSESIDALFFNKDYTPFSIARDQAIEKICKQLSIDCYRYDDALLNEPTAILNKQNHPYTVFTPYWKNASQHKVEQPAPLKYNNFYQDSVNGAVSEDIFAQIVPTENRHIAQHGGRKNAIKILQQLDQYKNYSKTHDIPSLDTTKLSAHIKFGTVSIRELYWKLIEKCGISAYNGLIRQLYWRDFYYQIAYHYPAVFGHAFQKKYDHIHWKENAQAFEHWRNGTTGFPIVDAGMRELLQTGFMHNRVRMIVASFLIKDLLIDWRKGEQYFAQQLVDYDPAVNNGNWQWVASTGADHQPYFRIFNPWLQQKKFDPECSYIKQWVPELRNFDTKTVHTWYKIQEKTDGYPAPIINHDVQKKHALALFRQYKTI